MKKLITWVLAACAITACTYDDSELWEKVNDHEERLKALEEWQKEMNNNITALQTLLSTTDYITAMTPIMENDVEVGYTITFLNSDPITIYHGRNGADGQDGTDGKDGAVPQVGITQGEDGNWYWTLNGELMTDSQSNPRRANGEKGDKGDKGEPGENGAPGQDGQDGEEGQDAPQPQLLLGNNLPSGADVRTDSGTIKAECFYLSVDNGETWYRVSGTDGQDGAPGQDGTNGTDGDSFFSEKPTIDNGAGTVTFKLADESSFTLPFYTGIKLVVSGSTNSFDFTPGQTQTITLTATGTKTYTTDDLLVTAPRGWEATLSSLRTRATLQNTQITLSLTAPSEADFTDDKAKGSGEVSVLLTDGQGGTVLCKLKVNVPPSYDNNKLTVYDMKAGELGSHITATSASGMTSLTLLGGELNETDYSEIKKYKAALIDIDLESAVYTEADGSLPLYTEPENAPLQTIKLPQGIKVLEAYAFNLCKSLKSITLPDGLLTIEEYALQNCMSLTEVTLPASLESIGEYAFRLCNKLAAIDLSDTKITSIEKETFNKCEKLAAISLPASLTTIGENAFALCYALEEIDLSGTQVTSIGKTAFYKITSLKSIQLPATLTTIGEYAFEGSALPSIDLSGTQMTTIGKNAFYRCSSLKSVTLPNGLETIDVSAFYECSSLTDIDLPATLTTIGSSAFRSCAFTSIDLSGTQVTTLGWGSFYRCGSLANVTLPATLTTINSSVFSECTSLTTVTCPATTPPTLGENVFKETTSLTNIYVPTGSVESYKTAWTSVNSKISSIPGD